MDLDPEIARIAAWLIRHGKPFVDNQRFGYRCGRALLLQTVSGNVYLYVNRTAVPSWFAVYDQHAQRSLHGRLFRTLLNLHKLAYTATGKGFDTDDPKFVFLAAARSAYARRIS